MYIPSQNCMVWMSRYTYSAEYTVGWGGKARVWSWPLTKIRVLTYFLVLNSIFGSKYPIFVKPFTINFQKTIFQAVSTKKYCLLELGWGLLRVSVKQKFCACLLVSVSCLRLAGGFPTCAPKYDNYDFRRAPSKQTKCFGFTATIQNKKQILKPILIGWKKIITPWRGPKIVIKKFLKYFRNFRVVPRWKQPFLTMKS